MAEDQDESSKTEEPTPRKLQEARKRGQVAQSQEVKHFFVLLGALIVVALFAPIAASGLTQGMGGYLSLLHTIPTDGGSLIGFMSDGLADMAILLLPPLLVLVVLAIAGGFVQHGFLVSAESLKPKPEKINPISGLKRQFSIKALMEFVKGILKLAVVGIVAAMVMIPQFDGLDRMAGMDATAMMGEVWWLAIQALVAMVAVMGVIAGADYLYQRFEFMKQQRMTKQEVKDEFKQSEGDPMVKARLRQLRMERARRRMMAAVPEADVVITNPTHYAVAMAYAPDDMAAPKVVAKGADGVAQRIRQVAEEHDVAIVENPPLARALFAAVEIDDEIPPEHYKAVAEVISYVFKLKQRRTPDRPNRR